MNKNNYSVYVHTFPNGKKYIGITCKKPELRWLNGAGYEQCRLMRNAIHKYGWESVKHEIIIDGISKDDAEAWEKSLIAMYKSNNYIHGYNLASGGRANCNVADSTKKILSDQRKGEKNPVYGIKGKDHFRARKINQYDIHGNFIRTWDCGIDIEEAGIADRSKVCSVCKGKRQTSGGYQWRYFNDNTDSIGAVESEISLAKCFKEKVLVYSHSGNLLMVFDSIKEASEHTGISRDSISLALNHDCKAGMYQFQYSINGKITKKINGSTSMVVPVCQYDLDGNLLNTFKDKQDASRHTGESYWRIERCLRLNKQVGDYIWRYAS